VLLGAFLASGCGSKTKSGKSDQLNLAHFLERLESIDHLADAPLGKAVLLSSNDPTGGNQDWGDYDKPADENGLVTVAEIEGPGVIHRIWMTGQDPKEWKFFLDGASEPTIQDVVPHGEGGTSVQQAYRLLQDSESGGYTSYLPIPFQKSLRIAVADTVKPDRPYFQINIECFPEGTKVTTLPENIDTHLARIKAISEAWNQNQTDYIQSLRAQPSGETSVIIPPNDQLEWLTQAGAGRLTEFRLKRTDANPIDPSWLRDVILEVEYGQDTGGPSIRCPLGDFFCQAFRARNFSSAPLGSQDGWLISKFPMPFSDGLRARLINPLDQELPFQIAWTIDSNAKEGRFLHASWSQTSSPSQSAGKPHIIGNLKGTGHVVGSYLALRSADRDWNILEGDDRIYLDGDFQPSLKGTGLEDYFNGAWYYIGLSDRPYSGLLEKAAMDTTQYRFHVPDPISFNSELKFEIEFGHVLGTSEGPNTSKGYMSSVLYWYQDTPVAIPELPSRSARQPMPILMEPQKIMSELIELERAGEGEAAAQRCTYYTNTFSGTAIADVLLLRKIGYNDLSYADIAAVEPEMKTPQGKAVLNLLRQMAQNSNQALLHLNCSDVFSATLNGKPVLNGKSYSQLYTAPIDTSGTGPLQLEVAIRSRGGSPYLGAAMQNSDGTFAAGPVWESKQGDTWGQQASKSLIYHTRYTQWNLQPNAYVGAQSAGMQNFPPAYFKPGADGAIRLRLDLRTLLATPALESTGPQN